MFGLIKKHHGPMPVEQVNFKPLRFDLSSNILQLAIPDNVSPDMPPTELIPERDINNSATFQQTDRVALMKVMWDFPKPGWRKRDYGSMVMTMWVHKTPERYDGDIFQREHLIKAIQLDLKTAYQTFNENVWNEGLAAGKLSVDLVDEMINFPENTDEFFQDSSFFGKSWISFPVSGIENHELFCSSLANDIYICLDFEFMKSDMDYLSDFFEICDPYKNKILETVKLTHTKNQEQSLPRGIVIDAEATTSSDTPLNK